MTSFRPESGPGMPFAFRLERMCQTKQIPLGSAPSVLLHGGPRMCPVLEVPEGLCVYHGLYRGVGCPGCSEGQRAGDDIRSPNFTWAEITE